MAVAGSLTYDAKIDKTNFKKGLNNLEKETSNSGTKIKNIVAGLGITKIIGKAFNLITSNMDSAIKRIDTLNNFPKVMSNLGISSEDSTKAIKKLSDGLKGIPTKLDDASLAVQRFTSINNDVNKSTDYFLAFNNALLAGGASAEVQANALEQLSQMYAVGTVDAQAWRSVQTAMPAQLQQVAESLGYTSTAVGGDFYNAMKSGKVSMEAFMNQIVKLNSEGTGQFASFAEQAKSATGGIQTSIDNAKTAVSRGVADITTAINQGLQDNGFGSIADIISDKGKKIENTLKTIAAEIPKVISWINQNKDALISLAGIITTVIGAYEVYKATLLIIKGIQIAQSVFNTVSAFVSLIPAIKSAKDAMLLLNMAFNLNPIGIIVTAIGLLVAAFIILWNKCEGFRNFWINLWEGIKKTFFTVVNFIKENWKELGTLLVNPIGGALALLYKFNPKFKEWVDNLGNNIKTFFTEKIPEFFNNIIDWFKSLPEKVGNEVNNLVQKISDTLKNGWKNITNFFTQTIPQWVQNVIQWFQQLPYMIGYHIGQIIGTIGKFGMNLWNWVTTELPQIIQGIIDWFKQLPEKIKEKLSQIVSNISEWGQQVYETSSTWVVDTINSIIEWFSQLPSRISEWLSNTVNDIGNWGLNIYTTSITWVSNAINSITEWFSQLPGKISEWLSNTIDRIKQWGNDMVEKGKTAALDLVNTIVDKIKELPDKMTEIGKHIVEGIWNGIKNAQGWIKEQIKKFSNGVVDGLKDSLGIHSPSRRVRDEVGKYVPEGFAVGIEANTSSAIKAIDDMNDKIMSEMNKAVAVETGSISTNAIVKSSANYNSIIRIENKLDGTVNLDNRKLGRIQAPIVARTIKAGGLV